MKYEVLWHDWEDERSGIPIEVEGDNVVEAYHKAVKELKEYAKHFSPYDISCLIDEIGKHHYPDFFLKEKTNF
ncbi:MAG TPA: hypothetical protein VJB11_03725 [archaeon]|nr:hypothetical protein [archaeon]